MTEYEPQQALAEAISAKWDSRDRVRTHLEQAADVIEELRESGWVLREDGPDTGITEGSPLGQNYMTRQELYVEACTPRSTLSEEFVASLGWRIIQDDPGYWDRERDNWFSQPWAVALRAAIGEAWDSYREAEFILADSDIPARTAQFAHGQRYVAMKVIRNITRELYRHTVPDEERSL